jgi:hypothetical protein
MMRDGANGVSHPILPAEAFLEKVRLSTATRVVCQRSQTATCVMWFQLITN